MIFLIKIIVMAVFLLRGLDRFFPDLLYLTGAKSRPYDPNDMAACIFFLLLILISYVHWIFSIILIIMSVTEILAMAKYSNARQAAANEKSAAQKEKS